MAVLHQPTRNAEDLKRVSRLVVLPDYQGIGIGRAFLDRMAALYVAEGHMFEIKTSARNLIGSLRRSPEWRCSSYQFSSKQGRGGKVSTPHRTKVKTATFEYRGGE